VLAAITEHGFAETSRHPHGGTATNVILERA
jgi:hypothetical protein